MFCLLKRLPAITGKFWTQAHFLANPAGCNYYFCSNVTFYLQQCDFYEATGKAWLLFLVSRSSSQLSSRWPFVVAARKKDLLTSVKQHFIRKLLYLFTESKSISKILTLRQTRKWASERISSLRDLSYSDAMPILQKCIYGRSYKE